MTLIIKLISTNQIMFSFSLYMLSLNNSIFNNFINKSIIYQLHNSYRRRFPKETFFQWKYIFLDSEAYVVYIELRMILIKLLSIWFENNNTVVRTVGFTSHFLSCGGKCFQKRTFGFNNYPIACAGANCTKT